uniref:Uncharacterized protein n=1 Tax=Cacopsylla melanoneura TaxID=428564 RepID=A0A8D9FEJ6_9HEMI
MVDINSILGSKSKIFSFFASFYEHFLEFQVVSLKFDGFVHFLFERSRFTEISLFSHLKVLFHYFLPEFKMRLVWFSGAFVFHLFQFFCQFDLPFQVIIFSFDISLGSMQAVFSHSSGSCSYFIFKPPPAFS